jgi:tRNA uridine 5-carboxymethylaminomethyl modification enzyme
MRELRIDRRRVAAGEHGGRRLAAFYNGAMNESAPAHREPHRTRGASGVDDGVLPARPAVVTPVVRRDAARAEGRRLIVVGGGHAAVEAALAASRLGADVTLVTLDPAAIGRMSCNPAVGGLAKGQLVREIDALGGLMGVAADAAAMQFRMLNTRKGPAVQSPRAQVDKEAYAAFVRAAIAADARITVIRGQVASFLVRDGSCAGVRLTDGSEVAGEACVLTTGTFLRGLMHVGEQVSAGGRVGEAPARELSAALVALGLELVRLKTGTPPRVDRRSVDLSRLEALECAPDSGCFSFRVTPPAGRASVPTWRTQTTAGTHDLVRASMHLSPYGRGALKGVGPRYCPSLEDKVARFPERESHRIFVERETAGGDSLYLNGLSNCLPLAVQTTIVRSVPGLEGARLLRPGYAVEYDAVPAFQLRPTLECRALPGLYLAGQINGTSGYEEAAAQGLMAGINAARRLAGADGVVLRRDEAYIGVLIDDLVTSSPTEPYRMFTSRAEHRLVLRQDNADRRLMPLGWSLGLLAPQEWATHEAREAAIAAGENWLGHADTTRRRRVRAGEALAAVLAEDDAAPALSASEAEQVELDVRYAGYVERHGRLLERVRALADVPLPETLDYLSLDALGREAREVLARVRPVDLAQASRLAGVTRADLQLLALRQARATRA